MKSKKLLLATALFAGAAFAQAPMGTVTTVQGVVTATQGATVVTVAPGTAIQHGMRFVTTSGGSVTLRLTNGCTVTVPASHGVTVLSTMTCQQLAAAVQPVVPVAGATPTGPTANTVNIALGLGAAAILAGIIASEDDDNEVLSAR